MKLRFNLKNYFCPSPNLGPVQAWPRPGQAGPGPAPPGLDRPCLSIRKGADLHENQLFIEKLCFSPILVISEPSRPQKWIWLEILRWKMMSGGLET